MQVETLLDMAAVDAMAMMSAESKGKRTLSLRRLIRPSKPRDELITLNIVTFRGYTIRELENGSVVIEQDGRQLYPAKAVLRELALHLNISLINANGNPLNTRSLGSQVIQSVQTLISNSPQAPQPITSGKTP